MPPMCLGSSSSCGRPGRRSRLLAPACPSPGCRGMNQQMEASSLSSLSLPALGPDSCFLGTAVCILFLQIADTTCDALFRFTDKAFPRPAAQAGHLAPLMLTE